MKGVEIARDRLIEQWQFGIDDKVIVAGKRLRYAGSSDLHVLDPEREPGLGGDRRPVLEVDKEYPGIRSRGLPRWSGLLRTGLDPRIQNYCRENNQAEASKSIPKTHKRLPQ